MTRDDFVGDWQVGRDIFDRQGQQTGRFDGWAVLLATGTTGLHYEETGQLRLGDAAPLTATRRYLWDFGTGLVQVAFADGRPFHSFVPGQTGAGTTHHCGADLYRVTYDFGFWPVWSAHWDVLGPRKDYAMHSHYHRASA